MANESVTGRILIRAPGGPVPQYVRVTIQSGTAETHQVDNRDSGRPPVTVAQEYDPEWLIASNSAIRRTARLPERIDENNPLTLARLVQSPDITLVNAAAD